MLWDCKSSMFFTRRHYRRGLYLQKNWDSKQSFIFNEIPNIPLSMAILAGLPATDILDHTITSFAMLLLSRNGASIISSAETTIYD